MGARKLSYYDEEAKKNEVFSKKRGQEIFFDRSKSALDYYPYGMQMPGRQGTLSGGEYRYGFQGQEKDDEIKGEGNSINYKYKMHDPRVGRFFAVDPLAAKYPHNGPYNFSENRVIDGVELEGLEVMSVGKNVTGAVIVGGSIEGGIVIDFNNGGVYGYGSFDIVLQTDISIASTVSVTYFPNMPSANYVAGEGVTASVSTAKWGPTLSVGVVSSSGYLGVNVQAGVGAGIMPLSAQVSYGTTEIRPINNAADREFALGILYESYNNIHIEAKSMMERVDNLTNENEQLRTNNRILYKSILNLDEDDTESKEIYQKQIDKNSAKIKQNESEIKNTNNKLNDLFDQLKQISTAIDMVKNTKDENEE